MTDVLSGATGILEVEDEEVEDDPNDEILTELKQAQANLRPLLQWKIRHLRHLLDKAREQQIRQQMANKFDECDAKVCLVAGYFFLGGWGEGEGVLLQGSSRVFSKIGEKLWNFREAFSHHRPS